MNIPRASLSSPSVAASSLIQERACAKRATQGAWTNPALAASLLNWSLISLLVSAKAVEDLTTVIGGCWRRDHQVAQLQLEPPDIVRFVNGHMYIPNVPAGL